MQNLAENKPLETAKHRELVAKYCIGDGLDLGSFTDPINSRAIRIDRDPQYCHIKGDVSDLSSFADESFDYVHSSHVLEDFADWPPVLAEWTRVLKPGGHLIIAVPDHERFRAAVAAGQGDNLDHKHESFIGEVESFLPDYKIELSKFTSPDDYSIIVVLRKPPSDKPRAISFPEKKLSVKTFGHSGDLGDVIYALPTIKAICERDGCLARIVLYRGPGVREAFDEKRALNLGDLLLELPFVEKFRYWPGRVGPGDVDYDFADWRAYYTKYCDNGRGNLARTPAEFFRVDPSVVDKPWITDISPSYVSQPSIIGGPSIKRVVVFARSPRYRNHEFPWHELANRYRHLAVTVGTEAEQIELAGQFDLDCNAVTFSLLDLAQIIAGAALVITNQTATYAIAEAMKKPCILERCPWVPNVDFDRPDVWSGERLKEFMAKPDPLTTEGGWEEVLAIPSASELSKPASTNVSAPKVSGVRKSV